MGGSMEDNEALDRIDEMRDLVNANLESIIAEQSAVFGEVAEVSGQVVLAGGKRIRPLRVPVETRGCPQELEAPMVLARWLR